jgi:hypothetical protein
VILSIWKFFPEYPTSIRGLGRGREVERASTRPHIVWPFIHIIIMKFVANPKSAYHFLLPLLLLLGLVGWLSPFYHIFCICFTINYAKKFIKKLDTRDML